MPGSPVDHTALTAARPLVPVRGVPGKLLFAHLLPTAPGGQMATPRPKGYDPVWGFGPKPFGM